MHRIRAPSFGNLPNHRTNVPCAVWYDMVKTTPARRLPAMKTVIVLILLCALLAGLIADAPADGDVPADGDAPPSA